MWKYITNYLLHIVTKTEVVVYPFATGNIVVKNNIEYMKLVTICIVMHVKCLNIQLHYIMLLMSYSELETTIAQINCLVPYIFLLPLEKLNQILLI